MGGAESKEICRAYYRPLGLLFLGSQSPPRPGIFSGFVTRLRAVSVADVELPEVETEELVAKSPISTVSVHTEGALRRTSLQCGQRASWPCLMRSEHRAWELGLNFMGCRACCSY